MIIGRGVGQDMGKDKPKIKINEKEVLDRIRKTIPPPSRIHKDKTNYDRKRDKKNWYSSE